MMWRYTSSLPLPPAPSCVTLGHVLLLAQGSTTDLVTGTFFCARCGAALTALTVFQPA